MFVTSSWTYLLCGKRCSQKTTVPTFCQKTMGFMKTEPVKLSEVNHGCVKQWMMDPNRSVSLSRRVSTGNVSPSHLPTRGSTWMELKSQCRTGCSCVMALCHDPQFLISNIHDWSGGMQQGKDIFWQSIRSLPKYICSV